MRSVEQPPAVEVTKEQVAVEVELRDDLAALAGGGPHEAVESYLRELVADLGIPAEPSLAIHSSPGVRGGDDPYTVRVAGRACGPALPLEPLDAAEAVSEAITATIAANRAFFLTPVVEERLVGEWKDASPAVGGASLSAGEVGQVLVDLVRRCIAVAPDGDRIGSPDASRPPGPIDSPDRLREAVLTAWREPSVTVLVDPGLVTSTEDSGTSFDYDLSTLESALLELFVDELGLLLPSVRFEADPALTEGRFRLRVNDLRFPPRRGLRPDEVLIATNVEKLEERGVRARPVMNPVHGAEAAVIAADDKAVAGLVADGFFALRPRGYVAFATRRELRRLAGSLLHSDAVTYQLNRMREVDAAVVDAALARFGPYLVTAVFRRLLDEEVPIRDGVGILEGMLAVGPGVRLDQSLYDLVTPDAASLWAIPDGVDQSAPGAPELAECARRHLRWHLTRGLANDESFVHALKVDRRWESRLRGPTALDEEERGRLRRATWRAYEPSARAGTAVVALTNSEVRRSLRRWLEVDFPTLPVLSRHELAPTAKARWIGEIGWD